MKLTTDDKKVLKKWGFKDEDFLQIERATRKTTYTMNGSRIPLKTVLEIMDRETYLSGISRSAFHWSSSREARDGQTVDFNSRKLFEED